MLLCQYLNRKCVDSCRDLTRRNIGFQRALGGNEDKKQTLRQVITEVHRERGKIEPTVAKKKWRKKGRLLGKGNFVDTYFVAQTGEVRSWFESQSKSSLTAQETLAAEREQVEITLDEWEKKFTKKNETEDDTEKRKKRLQSRFDRKAVRQEREERRAAKRADEEEEGEEGEDVNEEEGVDANQAEDAAEPEGEETETPNTNRTIE